MKKLRVLVLLPTEDEFRVVSGALTALHIRYSPDDKIIHQELVNCVIAVVDNEFAIAQKISTPTITVSDYFEVFIRVATETDSERMFIIHGGKFVEGSNTTGIDIFNKELCNEVVLFTLDETIPPGSAEEEFIIDFCNQDPICRSYLRITDLFEMDLEIKATNLLEKGHY